MIYRALLINKGDFEEQISVFIQADKMFDAIKKIRHYLEFFNLVSIVKFWVSISNYHKTKNSNIFLTKYKLTTKSPSTNTDTSFESDYYYIANSLEEVLGYVSEFLDYNPNCEIIELRLIETGLEFIE